MTIEIKTQKELDEEIKKGQTDFRFIAGGTFEINFPGKITVAVSAELKWYVLVKFFEKSSVVARGSARVEAWESSRVEAYIESAEDWCDYYGIEVKRGVAVLFKAVNEDFSSNHDKNFKYIPGTKPEAAEIDDQECSKGLHFCPHPRMAKDFHPSAKKFVACPIKVSELMINMEWQSPNKVKAKRVYQACYEVNEDGEKV